MNGIIRYRLLSSKGDVIFCNLDSDEIELISKIRDGGGIFTVKGVKYRTANAVGTDGEIILSSSSSDYLKSSRKFNTTLDVLKNTIGSFSLFYGGVRKQVNEDTKRLLHNLISLNAHNIQEIYSLMPQEDLADKQSGHLDMAVRIVKSNPRDVAVSLLRIMKNNVSMKTEFSVFKKLFDDNPNLDRRSHEVHKVLMNVFYLFFSDFTDKGVLVHVNASKLKATFDYESIHVALYYIIENAAKYILPNTSIVVAFDDVGSDVRISFKMKSIQVKESEVNAIFEEGYSGVVPRKTGQSGKGIGMSRVKKIIVLNSGRIIFAPEFDSIEEIRGIPYQENNIMLYLPKR